MNGNIKVVIGSWGSYNECNERALGSKWLDLSDYNDWDEIVEELTNEGFELNGIDEELFIQDVEGIPDNSINWDYVNPEELFNTLKESGVLDDELDFDTYFEVVNNERKYATETIKGYRRVLRTLFNEAVRYDWIAKNPVCKTKIGAGNNNTSLRAVPEKEVFSFKEAQEFLAALDRLPRENINYKVPIKIMLLTGVRNGELHGLRWEDIDFEKKVVHVRRNRLYNKEVGIYEKSPKTKTSVRDIPLTDDLIKDLMDYASWFREADANFDNRKDGYYIVSGIDREPLFPHTMSNWLKKFEEKNGFKKVTCHGLRHTYCSLLLAQNVPIQTVSKYMGHSDSTVTLKVYSHFIPDTQEKVVFALNNLTRRDD